MRQIVIDIEGGTDGHGWPPVTTERVWTKPLPGDRFEIDNVPFFAKGLSLGDIVTAKADESVSDGSLRFQEVVERGGHSTYRVIVASGLDADRHNAYHQLLAALGDFGITVEIAGEDFFAVDVPPSANCPAVIELLQVGEDEHIWEFEEGHYHSNDNLSTSPVRP